MEGSMSADGRAVAERPTSSSDPVLHEVCEAGVAVITLNRSERRTAWGGALTSTFCRFLESAHADPSVRVITGSGRAFCVGADMGDLYSISSPSVDGMTKTSRDDVTALVPEKHPYCLTQLSKPVVAAINGWVAGIGL